MSDQDYEERKKLFEGIKSFTRAQQEELYRILRRCDEELSENRNGMFFDLNALKKETIQKILLWMNYCEKNAKDLANQENKMKELLEEIKDEAQ